MTQDMRAMQADTSTQPRLRGEQFYDTRSGEVLLGSKQSTQQELIRLRVHR